MDYIRLLLLLLLSFDSTNENIYAYGRDPKNKCGILSKISHLQTGKRDRSLSAPYRDWSSIVLLNGIQMTAKLCIFHFNSL